MPDFADIAAEREQEDTARALAAQRAAAEKNHLPPTGHCYNCGEPIEGVPFCDSDCRDDYQHRRKCEALR